MVNECSKIKKPGQCVGGGTRNENYMILSTSYVLNNSDTKRMQIGLQTKEGDGVLKPVIKLSGNSSGGIRFDLDTWEKLQQHIERAGCYLRGITRDTPEPIVINNITIKFTTAYGVRAIMINYRQENESEVISGDSNAPPMKKRRTYEPSIVMQKPTFEGLENVVKCINARYKQLDSLVKLVNDCVQFLIGEIELNLPKKKSPDEGVVEQTLAMKYNDIEENVRRQIKDLPFLDAHFEIVFQELTSIHLHEIVRTIVMNTSSS